MKKLILCLLLSSLMLSSCTQAVAGSSFSSSSTPMPEPLDLPVAKVSGEYAEDAMKILKSFYDVNAKELVSEDVLNAPVIESKYDNNGKVIEEIEYHVVDGWYYENYGIDFYTYIGDLTSYDPNNQDVLENLFADAYKASKAFYTDINFYVLLEQNGKVVGMGNYGGGVGQTDIQGGAFNLYPATHLFLDDKLMKALKDEGFDTSNTTAKCASINPFLRGIYFSDGKIERYYPTFILMSGMEEVVELNKFYTPVEVFDIMDKSSEVSAKFWGFSTPTK